MRANLLPEVNQVINPVMDVTKLRTYTSTFKRHTIRRFIRPSNIDPKMRFQQLQSKMRLSAGDYFFYYCRQVLPRIEEKIELQLLEKYMDRF
jgi:hypothetical protein